VQGEVVVYTASGWNALADGLRDAASPCAHYYLSIPAVDDGTGRKTMPRAAEAARMRARGARFHALAEFHWTSWNNTAGMTWLAKGVEFRRRMAAAGYDVAAGDGWAINELPSSARTDLTIQRAIRDVVRGLHDGATGAPAADGAVFVIGTSSANMNPTGVLKPDPRAYHDCLQRLGLPASACVFVDDQPRNVEGARAVGMIAIAFDVRDPARSFSQALSALGLAP
jgi:hypothetical protein